MNVFDKLNKIPARDILGEPFFEWEHCIASLHSKRTGKCGGVVCGGGDGGGGVTIIMVIMLSACSKGLPVAALRFYRNSISTTKSSDAE